MTGHSLITNQALTNESKPSRRTLIGGELAAVLSSALAPAGRVMAQGMAQPNDPFILLLKGLYQPVVPGEDLGLSSVDVDDGSYVKTHIYPVFGIRGSENHGNAIGTFYGQVTGTLCAYGLPGGAIAMSFNSVPPGAPPGYGGLVPFPDGKGGQYLEGTSELAILEANGIYRALAGGHNHMVDRLHQLPSGEADEFCFCIVSRYQFP